MTKTGNSESGKEPLERGSSGTAPQPQPSWPDVMVQQMHELVGAPDYAIAFYLGPWPDGGWMASLCLTSREWAQTQVDEGDHGLLPGVLALTETNGWPHASVFNGFGTPPHAFTEHGSSPEEAVAKLHAVVADEEQVA